MEWVSMAEQMHASLTSTKNYAKRQIEGVKHADTGLWSSGNLFCGGMNHAFLFGSLMQVWV